MTGEASAKRLLLAGLLVLLVPFGGRVSALLLGAIVAALLTALALWELRDARGAGRPPREASA